MTTPKTVPVAAVVRALRKHAESAALEKRIMDIQTARAFWEGMRSGYVGALVTVREVAIRSVAARAGRKRVKR